MREQQGKTDSAATNIREDIKPSSLRNQGQELPLGWMPVRLSELGMIRTENIEPADEPDTEFELWSVPSFPSGTPEIVRGEDIGSNKQRVMEGDVLLCKINPRINRVWRVGPPTGQPQIASTEWIVFRSAIFDPDFLMWRFREGRFRELLQKTVAGVGGSLTRARPQEVGKIQILLPPVAEQQRIVARLEVLEARSSRARVALNALPVLLAQARQSLLSAAFRGDLTADWRAKNPDSPSGAQLLEELQEAHRQAGTRSRGNAAQATEGVHDLSEDLLPASWVAAELRDLCHPEKPICYGILMPGPEKDDGVPYIRVADFPNDRVRIETVRNTSIEIDAKFSRSRLTAGDLLLSIRGTVGRVAVVPPELNGANITQDSARLSIHESVSASFIAAMLRAPDTQRRMQRAVKGVAVRGINIGDVRPLQVPLPPLDEQLEIVRRLENAFARLDAVAAVHADSIAELDRLDASLLAKAFRGELVTQDPADEPAAVTLQRIRTPREVFDPFAYLFQFIPALLRASDGTLPFARALEGCALLRVPRDLIRLLAPIAGAPARQHFERFEQPLKDGSFEPVLRKLIAAGAIMHDARGDHKLRLIEAKSPPIAPLIAEDARLVASVLALVPSDTLEDLVPRHTRKLCPNTATAMLAF